METEVFKITALKIILTLAFQKIRQIGLIVLWHLILTSCGFKQGQREYEIHPSRRNAGMELGTHQPETTLVRTDGLQQTAGKSRLSRHKRTITNLFTKFGVINQYVHAAYFRPHHSN